MWKPIAVLLVTLVSSLAQTGDETEIRRLEHAWDQANLKGDADALARILATEFIMTGDDGKVHSKAEVLEKLRSRRIAYESAKTEELKVMLHGDAAVTNGRWRGAYTNRGKKVELVERFTNFYVRRNGRWLCVASHGSAIKP